MVRNKRYSLVAKTDGSGAKLTRYRGAFDGENLEDEALSTAERAIKKQFEAKLAELAETRLTSVDEAAKEQARKAKR